MPQVRKLRPGSVVWRLQMGTAALVLVFSQVALADGTYVLNPTDGLMPVALTPGGPAGAYRLSGFEAINLNNGHLNIVIPHDNQYAHTFSPAVITGAALLMAC